LIFLTTNQGNYETQLVLIVLISSIRGINVILSW